MRRVRIGRAGEQWGPYTLLGRAGVAWDGKRAWYAKLTTSMGDPRATEYLVVIQGRWREIDGDPVYVRTAWALDVPMFTTSPMRPMLIGGCVPEVHLGTFMSWHSMVERVTRKSHKSYPNYGGRGVTIDLRWLPVSKSAWDREVAFSRFLQDVGIRPAGTSLDRIDPTGNYEPGNVRWATKEVQVYNKRRHWGEYGRRRAA